MVALLSAVRGILAIETSQERGSVAWSPGPGAPAVEELFSIGLVHGREIIPRIEALRARADFAREEIELVAVSAGPGSFTGLRIGISAAKALAFALGRPALAVSSLEAIARGVPADGGHAELAVLLDARRGRVYGARFRRTRGRLERLTADRSLPPEEFFAELPPGALLVGAGSRTIAGAERFGRLPEEIDTPSAAAVIAIARERLAEIAAGGEVPPEFEDPHLLVPTYLLRTGAEEAREGGP
jgi:tRNA threonylcarbamoyladenosine biosynthesis protein TsaB